jgi:hypothetical protein
MCMATAAGISAIAGTGMQMLGAVRQGNAAGDAAAYRAQVARNQAMLEESNAQVAEYNATMSENNAIIADRAAERAIAVGAAKAEARSVGTAARLGTIKAGQAASGVDVNTGSAVDVRAGTRAFGKLDAETDMANAALENYGFRVRATDARAQAGLQRHSAAMARYRGQVTAGGGAFLDNAASEARTSGWLNAAGTLAGNASQLPWKWLGGGSGGDFVGTPGGAAQYGSAGYEGSSSYGGPR